MNRLDRPCRSGLSGCGCRCHLLAREMEYGRAAFQPLVAVFPAIRRHLSHAPFVRCPLVKGFPVSGIRQVFPASPKPSVPDVSRWAVFAVRLRVPMNFALSGSDAAPHSLERAWPFIFGASCAMVAPSSPSVERMRSANAPPRWDHRLSSSVPDFPAAPCPSPPPPSAFRAVHRIRSAINSLGFVQFALVPWVSCCSFPESRGTSGISENYGAVFPDA